MLALYTKKSTILPATYYAATISRLPFSLIELVLSALAIWQLKHTPKIAIKKMYNKFGQELDESGQPLPRKVDLKRLMKLAVPVSVIPLFRYGVSFGCVEIGRAHV